MRLLYATYPWAFETVGGGEIQLLNYERYLNGSSFQIVRHNPWDAQLKDIDAVHFFSCMGGSGHFCSYVKQRSIPLIVTSSLWLTEENKHEYPLVEVSHQLSMADVILVNGDSEKEGLVSIAGVNPEKVQTIRNGFDPLFAEEVSPSAFLQAFNIDYEFILNIGNIEPRKNQLNLIRAARSLGMRIVLIGAIRDHDYARLCMDESFGSILHIDYLKNDDILLRSAIAASSVFCLPSKLETPGLAALEAAAAGACLVITKEGSTFEYFDHHAIYVDPLDVRDISEGIKAALAAQKSNALCNHVRSRFAWPDVVKKLGFVYESLRCQ